MIYVDDLEEVMHSTGKTDYVELQKMGYDVLSYLKRKQTRLLNKIDEIQRDIDVCTSASVGYEDINDDLPMDEEEPPKKENPFSLSQQPLNEDLPF